MEELVRFQCGSCGKVLKAKRSLVGKIGKCPDCSTQFTIPEPVPVVEVEDELPDLSGLQEEATQPRQNLKACPYCAEMIQAAAIKCRYCGEMLSDIKPPVQVPATPSQPKLIKEIRACVRKGMFGKVWGNLTIYSDKITFKGESEHSDDTMIRLADVMDVNDRRDGGQQLLIIRFKDSKGSMRSVEYDYPSTFGERMTTPNDRRTSWNDWVRIINDLAVQNR